MNNPGGEAMATVRLDQKRHALVRAIPDSFSNALANFFGTGPTDVDAARRTHLSYCEAFENNGIEVTVLAADEAYPDCVFVEDQAVVIDGHVLLPLTGAPSRRGEQPVIEDALIEAITGGKVCRMELPAMMDGGDILRLGNIFFVGRSTRTNDAGINELKSLLDHLGHELRVLEIPRDALHLTSLSSTPTDEIILAPEGYLAPESFGDLPPGCEVIMIPQEEAYGCNTLGLPNGKVMVAEGYPTVTTTLEQRGLEVVHIDMEQIRAADGSLTCISLFI